MIGEGSILQEMNLKDRSPDTFKITGLSRLQTIDEVNCNRRIYSTAIGERFVESANNKIKNGRMLGEMDHPTITNPKDPGQLKRQMVVLFERVSHKFNRIWMENKTILSEVETTSNRLGVDLARMAYVDKIPIGFSCRAMGKVKPSSSYKGVMEVVEPAHFVTYDSVTDPSHKTAQLTSITDVMTNVGNIDKVCTALPVIEGVDLDAVDVPLNKIFLDESVGVLEFKQFYEFKDPVQAIVKGFLGISKDKNISESRKVSYGKKGMDMLLQEFLNTSDKKYGISSTNVLNESNVHSLMQDYANTHKTEYNTSDKIRNKILKYLR